MLAFHSAGGDVRKSVGGAHPIPFKTLRNFDRVTVRGGVSPVSFWELGPGDFALVNEFGASMVYPGSHSIAVSGFGGVQYTVLVNITGAPFTLSSPPLPP